MLTTFSGRQPSQNEEELRGFITLLQERGVHRYLEIGAREGDTFHEVMISLPRGSVGVAVDLPGGLWGKLSTRNKLARAVQDLKQRGREATCLFGDSKATETMKLVSARGPYHAALIDGDHSYDGVAADWANYGDLAPVVAFHDIVGFDQMEKVHGTRVEVPRLWAEIKDSGLQVREFIAPGSAMGIGVVLR